MKPAKPAKPATRPDSITASIGREAENLACCYLQEQGLQLLERNYRCKQGEIDLVMRDTTSIVFVEVRYRRNHRFGSGAESVNLQKQTKLTATALHYLQSNKAAAKSPARFDVVSVTVASSPGSAAAIQWIKNAFNASF